MPRNKYPEETVQIIFDAALKQFIEKGYENTSILDIVGDMKGLTRGAFYHHFKSKEEVFIALTDKLFNDIEPFEKVKSRTDLNGLEKLQLVIQIFNENEEYIALQLQILPLLENSPTALKLYIEEQVIMAPRFAELIEEGINDGSIKAKYSKFTAELFLLICNIWMMPTIYPQGDEEEAWQRFGVAKDILEFLGLPVLNKELTAHVGMNEQGAIVKINN